MMIEDEIREFVDDALAITGDNVTTVERITERWLQDREATIEDARDAIYDDARDGWYNEA